MEISETTQNTSVEMETSETTQKKHRYLGHRTSSDTVDNNGKLKQDNYATPRGAIVDMFIHYSAYIQNLTEKQEQVNIYCPANGAGGLSSILEELSIEDKQEWNFIKRDKYIGECETLEDYLESKITDYTIIIENPPWGKNVNLFLTKAYASKLPFVFLLSIQVLTAKKTYKILSKNGAVIHLLIPSPKFMHEGIHVQVGACVWVAGNIIGIKEIIFGKTFFTTADDGNETEVDDI